MNCSKESLVMLVDLIGIADSAIDAFKSAYTNTTTISYIKHIFSKYYLEIPRYPIEYSDNIDILND